MALSMLVVAARPADEEHRYGHGKAEYFSSFFEGALILLASAGIGVAAIRRLLMPHPLEQLGTGLLVTAAATIVNAVVAVVILRAGRRHRSITLEANARHLLTDVWTSGGVIVGVGAVSVTGWLWLDPVVAIAVAANIVATAIGIIRASVSGLMDTALPPDEQAKVEAVLAKHTTGGVHYHALRTRQAGTRRFVSMHVLVPGEWTVQRGHHLLEQIEEDVRAALGNVTVFTHLEPADDPRSFDDQALDRR